jgi:hypothetical protein
MPRLQAVRVIALHPGSRLLGSDTVALATLPVCGLSKNFTVMAITSANDASHIGSGQRGARMQKSPSQDATTGFAILRIGDLYGHANAS